jgi:hypothetical protein
MHRLLLAAGIGIVGAAPVNGLRYDIHMTVTTVNAGAGQSSRAYGEGLAHAQIIPGKGRIDVAKGPIGVMTDGEFLITHDTTTLLFDPQHMQYAQVDPAKMMQGLSGVIGGLNAMVGVQATNVKVDEAALGAGDKLGTFSTLKYRITEDYAVALNVMGMGSSMTAHTTTDYWFVQGGPTFVNPFVSRAASQTQLPVNLGPQYAAQMAAARAKLPAGVPMKTMVVTLVTDANGNRTTTTTTWELTNVAIAAIPDGAFDTPAGYSQLSGPEAMMMMTGGGATGAGATMSASSPPTATSTHPGSSTSGVGGAAAGAAGGVGNAAKQGAVSGVTGAVSGAASSATTNAVSKILHIP